MLWEVNGCEFIVFGEAGAADLSQTFEDSSSPLAVEAFLDVHYPIASLKILLCSLHEL